MYHGVRWVCIPRSDPPPGQGSAGMGCAEGLPPYRFVSRFPVNHWWGLFFPRCARQFVKRLIFRYILREVYMYIIIYTYIFLFIYRLIDMLTDW